MRLKITHETTVRFSNPANGSIQTLRMQPRGLNGQFVESWQLDVSADCLLKPVVDPYGNATHTFSVPGPLTTLTVLATGIVATEDTIGVVRGTSERLPLPLFLRDTDRTKASQAIRDFAETVAAVEGPGTLAVLHGLMKRLHDGRAVIPSSAETDLGAEAAFTSHDVTVEALAHIFIASARALGIPARYVSGYRLDDKNQFVAPAVHGWIEAWVEGIGWIGFDAAHDVCPSEPYVRLATGLDCYDAMPIRVAPYGALVADSETMIQVEHLPDV